MKAKTVPQGKTAARQSDSDRFIARLERIEKEIQKAGSPATELLPDLDVIKRVASIEYEHLNPGPTRDHQQVVKNLVKLLSQRANPEEGGALALEFTETAFTATLDLGLRAGFFIGMARGCSWTAQMGADALAAGKTARPAKGRRVARQ